MIRIPDTDTWINPLHIVLITIVDTPHSYKTVSIEFQNGTTKTYSIRDDFIDPFFTSINDIIRNRK